MPEKITPPKISIDPIDPHSDCKLEKLGQKKKRTTFVILFCSGR